VSEAEVVEVKTRSFTIRLTPDDQAALADLCDLYGLDRPDSIRRAMRQVLAWKRKLGKSGYFVPVGDVQPLAFLIQLEEQRDRR
jgi:hypothetical protein